MTEETFTLSRSPAPRVKKTEPPPPPEPMRQLALFDAGRQDLPGQALLFEDIGTQQPGGFGTQYCACGARLRYYGGALGYEALVCTACGEHWNDNSEEEHIEHMRRYSAGERNK